MTADLVQHADRLRSANSRRLRYHRLYGWPRVKVTLHFAAEWALSAMQRTRRPVDLEALVKRSTSGKCFVCEFLKGNPEYQHHLIDETEAAIAFLAKLPTLYGYVIVAPKEHLEQVTGDFAEESYLELQRLIYRVAEGVRALLAPERVYILSLGSQAANSHVHWHIAPLPMGVPLERQQYYALMHENGAIETTPKEMAKLAQELRAEIGVAKDGA